MIGLLHVYNTERLNELSQELDNLYSLYAGKKVKTRCRDLYNVHKRVIKIDIFRGVSLITVCIKWDNRKQFFLLHERKPYERTDVQSEHIICKWGSFVGRSN